MEELKQIYPLCTSVAFYSSKMFRRQAWQVKDDQPIILEAFNRKDTKVLDFYEMFYSEMKDNRDYEKCQLNNGTRTSVPNEQLNMNLAQLIDDKRAIHTANWRKSKEKSKK